MSILKQESLLPLEEELRGFSRTIAEIDWLMLIVVLAFQFIQPLGEESRTAIMMALFFFAGTFLDEAERVNRYVCRQPCDFDGSSLDPSFAEDCLTHPPGTSASA